MTQDTQSKWVVRLVSAGIVAMLGFFAVENYRLILSRVEDQKTALVGLMALSSQRENRTTALETNQAHILETLRRIEDKQDALLKRVR